MKLLYKHPDTVSGIAVDEATGMFATSCYDGNARLFNQSGALVATLDQSPGTVNQSRQCVACRKSILTCGEFDDYAIAVRDDLSLCTKADVPTSRMVRGISERGLYAVADDLRVYNLASGTNWWIGTIWPERTPMGVCEDGESDLWTCGLDGIIRKFTAYGLKTFERLITSEGLNSIDIEGDLLMVTDWNLGITLMDRSGLIRFQAKESSLIHQAKFHEGLGVLYGTHDGRLCRWDGSSEIFKTTATTTPSKPGKRRK